MLLSKRSTSTMPSGSDKKYQLGDILSDNVSIMEADDVSEEFVSLEDQEAKEGFCVECKDQEVRSRCDD